MAEIPKPRPKHNNPFLKEGELRSFGRLASRMSDTQRATLLHTVQHYALHATDWQKFTEVELEIGMGEGLALFARAKAQPQRLFIGCEVYLNGLAKLVHALQAEPQVKNVRIIPTDVRSELVNFPENSLNTILIPYPDPWPKARHHKRRLVQQPVLTELARVLKPEGEWWLITDIPAYATWAADCVAQEKSFCKRAVHTSPPHWWITTKYEQKAYKEGRIPQYLQFKIN